MMRALSYTMNPVTQSYEGDTFNTRAAHNAFVAMDSNFRTLESQQQAVEHKISDMQFRINACYEFIEWVQKHSPETLTAYKAHNTVLHAFDKAEQGEFGYAQAETSA